MSSSRLLPIVTVVTLILSLQCAHKSGGAKKTLIVLGKDTLTSSMAAELDPADGSDSAHIIHGAMRLLLCQMHPGSYDTLKDLFTDRLSLVTGTEWTSKGAATLLGAAEALALTPVASGECDQIGTMADSLMKILQNAPKQGFSFRVDSSLSICDESADLRSRQKRALVLLLGVNDETAMLCHDFVFKKAVVPQASDDVQAKKMVSGLLGGAKKDSAVSSGRSRPAMKELQKAVPVSSTNALAFRKEQSIRDTVTRHIPTLRQLYKKGLKIDATMKGKVVVTFSVTPEGTVSSAVVKSSTIANQAFQRSLCGYLRQVRFQKIPESAGMMFFDFPFEFNPEM